MTPSAVPAPAATDDRISATAVVATTAGLVSLVLTSIVLSPSASANRPDPTAGLEPVGMVRRATSVAVHDGPVAVAEHAHPVQRPDSVVPVDAEGLARLDQVQVGALPDLASVAPE